jgi:hypothetical protein
VLTADHAQPAPAQLALHYIVVSASHRSVRHRRYASPLERHLSGLFCSSRRSHNNISALATGSEGLVMPAGSPPQRGHLDQVAVLVELQGRFAPEWDDGSNRV